MTKIINSIYLSLLVTSIVSFCIGIVNDSKISHSATFIGYCILSLSILLCIFIISSSINKNMTNANTITKISSIIGSTLPFIVLLGIIGFLLYLLITYKNIIINDLISSSYHSFNNITIFLILIPFFVVYKLNILKSYQNNENVSKIINISLLYLSILTFTSVLIQFKILKYFTTDGFQ